MVSHLRYGLLYLIYLGLTFFGTYFHLLMKRHRAVTQVGDPPVTQSLAIPDPFRSRASGPDQSTVQDIL